MPKSIFTKSIFAFFFWLILLTNCALAQNGQVDHLLKEMKWRNIGPANFAGRIVDVEAVENDITHVVVASASGGVWKSVNAGITWQPIFDDYGSASLGDIKIFQKNPDILWVGTGEANNRNSVAWGDGIYKSTDGGKSFQHTGLRETYQIARIVTHPQDENTVYVAAIGYLWGYSGDRGLFKTTDGGATWTKLTNGLPNDGKTGAIDLVMDPNDPNTLFVAFYQRLRKPYRFDSGGPNPVGLTSNGANGGIFKSTDGGQSWRKLTNGLPPGDTGRIGLDVYRKNPKIIMAIIEHGFQPEEYQEDYADMTKLGTGIYRSEDGGESWQYVNRYNNRPFYYSQIRINPQDDQRVYVLSTTIRLSEDGGRTFQAGALNFEGGLDYHAMWIDPNDGDRYYLGKDKGLTLTYDHGAHFQLFDNMPVGQFYAIGVDMRDPYYVYGGTQDNGTWGGPSFSKDARGILADGWWKLHWGDGMFIQIDPTDWRKGYTEAENGSFRRYEIDTRRVESTRPGPNNIVNAKDYLTKEELEKISRSSSSSGAGRAASEIEARMNMARYAELLRDSFRFNWRAPMVMSPHNPQTLFLGGNHLFKTSDGGYNWLIISPDLSTNDPVKTDDNTGGLTRDATGAESHCSITTISESPLVPGVIWVGTDDGNIQITKNGGANWANMRGNVPDVPEGIWVSCIEASHFDPATAYVTFDGHRSDNRSTWIFKTTDYGNNWQQITSGIPNGQVMYVVREDVKNKNLLFAGSEFACFVSIDGGTFWTRLMKNMPTVAFHDLVIHPRDGDLVAGTHGRSLWILDDIAPLQQLTDKVLASEAHLFEQRPATIWEDASRGGVRGHFYYAAENPPSIPKRDDVVRAKLINGSLINYYLKSAAQGEVKFEISDLTGENKATFTGPGEAGINRVLWNLTFDPPPAQQQRALAGMERVFDELLKLPKLAKSEQNWIEQTRKEFRQAKSEQEKNSVREKLIERYGDIRSLRRVLGIAFSGGAQGREAAPGEYLVKMTVDSKTYSGKLIVREDPMLRGRQ